MPTSSLVGRVLGNYRVVALIGAGGMGEVYRAHDERLDRDVALKILPAAFCGDEGKLRRFEQEARSLAALNDPNLLAIFDVGAQEGTPYIVSELLEGMTLRQRLLAGPLPVQRAIDFAMQIARGLMAAHEKRIVHRDLKPENIFVTNDGRIKILDFGVAKLAQPEAAESSGETATLLTTSGVVLGTVGYMSPEQVRGQAVDHRSDIFSFGAILYEMLSGKRAFQGPTTADTISSVLKEEPPDIGEVNANVPPATAHILRHCLEKRPEERFQLTRDLLFDLSTLSTAATTTRRMAAQPKAVRWHLRTLVAGTVLLGMLSLGLFLGRQNDHPVPSYHQVTFRRGTVWSARFTADAHTIVYGATWNGNPLGLFSTRPESLESRSLGLPNTDLLAVSSSGEMAVLLNRREVAHFIDRGTLARVPLSGGAPREVLEDVQQADWSPDASELAVVHHVGNRERLEFPIGKALSRPMGGFPISGFRPGATGWRFWSTPAGGMIGDGFRWWTVAGHKQRLSEEFSSEQGLAWSGKGDDVRFTATRSGEASALYAVTTGGKQRLVARGPTNLTLDDIARDGTVLLSSDNYSTPVVALPPGQTAERDLSWLDALAIFDLSDDGKSFLFQYYGEGSGTNYTSYLGKTDGSPAVRLGDGAAIALSPDGKWALSVVNEPRQTVLLPTGPGQIRKLERPGLDSDGDDTWAADGKHVVFTAREPGKGPRCYQQDIEGGRPQALTPPGFSGTRTGPRMSPDGKFLLVRDGNDKLVLFPLSGGQPSEVRGLNPDEMVLRWSGDSRRLYLYRPPTSQIFALDPFSGHRQFLRERRTPGSGGDSGSPEGLSVG